MFRWVNQPVFHAQILLFLFGLINKMAIDSLFPKN